MARELKYGITFNTWDRLTASLEANIDDFPHLVGQHGQLTTTLTEVRELSTRQAALTAEKQETTRRLQELLVEGRKLATFLRSGIRQRYGNRAEKLVEFGLQPFRGRTRPAAETKPPVTPPPAPADDNP